MRRVALRADKDRKLLDPLVAANLNDVGLIFLGQGGTGASAGNFGLNALSAITGDPDGVVTKSTAEWISGQIDAASHPLFDDITNGWASISSALSCGNFVTTYRNWDGDDLVSAYSPSPPVLPKMIGMKDRNDTGGARHVILGSIGMSSYGHNGYWNHLSAGRILRNAIEWARTGAQ